jgi:hypothetical protein
VTVLAPIEDPAYEPTYRPQRGFIPSVVAKWGPRSQLRWFRRFHDEIGAQKPDVWARFYCSSEAHRGTCCGSCIGDWEEGYREYYEDDLCCCKAARQDGWA